MDKWDISENLYHLSNHEKAVEMLTRLDVPIDTPYCITSIAGLQYYDIDAETLSGKVEPDVDERLLLIREPKNEYDKNAIQVRNDNGEYMLGHIPRDVAYYLAPTLDELRDVRAAVWRKYNGRTWSLAAFLYGKDLPIKIREKRYLGIPYPKEKYENDLAKINDAERFESEIRFRRKRKRDEIAAAFLADEIEAYIKSKVQDLSDIVKGSGFTKKRDHKNRIFTCEYYDLPFNLKTKTTWSSYGYKPQKAAKPYAKLRIKSYGKLKVLDLYHAADLEPKKVTKTTREKWTKEFISKHLNGDSDANTHNDDEN